METLDLHDQIQAVCPIDGVSVGRENDKLTWRIDFKPEATAPQRANAQAVVAAFDFNAVPDPDTIAGKDFDGMSKAVKAALLVLRQYSNALQANTQTQKTIAQLRADFIAAWKSLP
jgi:hypothetical protein